MKIAILYICTGKYNQFFDGFYQSCEMYFLAKKAEKTYFIWTDDDTLGLGKRNVRLIYKECSGFPADSLFRFEMFLQAAEELREYDYIYFFNANAKFLVPVNEELLPDDTGLAMGVWGGVEAKRHPMFYSYERNRKSLAYIPPFGKNYRLFMGGLNGGRPEEILQMYVTLAKNIRDDYDRGIVAIAHDQSHINAYLRNHPCKVISPEYCWPEEWNANEFEPKIIFRDKVRIDRYFNKGRDMSVRGKIQKGMRLLYHAIRWYLFI